MEFAVILPPSIVVALAFISAAAPPDSSGVIVSLLAAIVFVSMLPPCIVVCPSVDRLPCETKLPAVITPLTSIKSAPRVPAVIESASISTAFTKSALRAPIWAACIEAFLIRAVSI